MELYPTISAVGIRGLDASALLVVCNPFGDTLPLLWRMVAYKIAFSKLDAKQ